MFKRFDAGSYTIELIPAPPALFPPWSALNANELTANGFSNVFTQSFGQRGQHARAAMGCGTHARNVPFMVDMVLKLKG